MASASSAALGCGSLQVTPSGGGMNKVPSRVFARLRAAGLADGGSSAWYCCVYGGVTNKAGTTGECVVGDETQSTAAIPSGPEEVDDPVCRIWRRIYV